MWSPKMAPTTRTRSRTKHLPCNRWLYLFGAIFQSISCAGTIFGWVSMSYILQKEGIFNSNSDTKAQSIALNSVYTAASVFSFVVPLAAGLFLDRYGPRTTIRGLSSIFAVGAILLLISIQTRLEVLLYLAFVCIGSAASANILPLYPIAQLFPSRSGLVLSVLNGSFDCGSIVYLIMAKMYDSGIPFRTLLLAYVLCPVLVLLLMAFFLWPSLPFDQALRLDQEQEEQEASMAHTGNREAVGVGAEEELEDNAKVSSGKDGTSGSSSSNASSSSLHEATSDLKAPQLTVDIPSIKQNSNSHHHLGGVHDEMENHSDDEENEDENEVAAKKTPLFRLPSSPRIPSMSSQDDLSVRNGKSYMGSGNSSRNTNKNSSSPASSPKMKTSSSSGSLRGSAGVSPRLTAATSPTEKTSLSSPSSSSSLSSSSAPPSNSTTHATKATPIIDAVVSTVNDHHDDIEVGKEESSHPESSSSLPGIDSSHLSSLPLLQQVKSPEFMLYALFFIMTIVRFQFYIGTLNTQLDAIGQTQATYAQMFGYILPCGALSDFVAGYILDKFGPIFGMTCLCVLALVFSILNLIPYLPIQPLTFVVFACFRGFLFCNMTVYIASVFGYAKLGSLVGLLTTLGGIVGLVQTPLLLWAYAAGGSSSSGSSSGGGDETPYFLAPNLLMLAIVVIGFGWPMWLSRRAKVGSLASVLRNCCGRGGRKG